MKLDLPIVNVVRSEEFEEENFSIGNLALIMDILRNKMYTNPIRTICQEIMSNARDAHREVGKNDLPIEVKLPSQCDSNFYVKDFGPGITPDRMSNVFIQYGNCIAGKSMVWGPDSYKQIKNIKVGDRVYSYDYANCKIVIGTVKNTYSNGKKKCYKIKTLHREIIATANHPILCFNKKIKKYEYKKVEDLVCKRYKFEKKYKRQCLDRIHTDQIVLCTESGSSIITNFSQVLLKSINDYAVTLTNAPRKLINLTDKIPDWFCRFFGFLLGDGWRGNEYKGIKYSVSFATSEYDVINSYYKECVNNLGLEYLDIKNTKDNKYTQVKINSVILSQLLSDLGWIDGFNNKRIPSWVFGLTQKNRLAFLKGFIDADGWKTNQNNPLYHFEISNKEMSYDFKSLVDSLGYRSGNIRKRGKNDRKKTNIVNGREIIARHDSYMLTFSMNKKFSSNISYEYIIDIKEENTEDVFDIEIDNEFHNFIADGIIVHNSTKRDDNTQTGGFGLGAKSPFAYTDTFCIVSITPQDIYKDKQGEIHENCMVRRQYVAHIDESRIGKLSLVSSGVTEELQGTQIIIDARRDDHGSFSLWVQKTAQYWNTKPTILGCDNFSWKNKEVILSGDGWILEAYDNNYYNYEDNHMKALVDGIPYSISEDFIDTNTSDKSYKLYRKLFESPVRIYFKIGDLQLTANRENLENNEKNKKSVGKYLSEILKDMEEITKNEISKCPNLWSALSKWKEFRKSNLGSFVKEVEYKGIKISDESSNFAMPKDKVDYFLCIRKNGFEPKVKKGGYLFFTTKTVLYIDNTESVRPSRGRIATLFKENPDISEVQVIKFLTTDVKELKELNDKFYIDQLSSGNLSDVVKMKNLPILSGRTRRTIVKAKLLDSYRSWEDAEDIDLAEDSGVYVALSYRKAIDEKTKKEYCNLWTLSDIAKKYNIDIYGIPERYIKKLGDNWVPLRIWIKNKIDKLREDKNFQLYGKEYFNYGDDLIHKSYSYLYEFIVNKKILDKIENKESTIHKYMERSNILNEAKVSVTEVRNLCGIIGEKIFSNDEIEQSDIIDLSKEFRKRYPLLIHLSSYVRSVPADNVVFYINAVEKNLEKEVAKVEE